VYVYVCVIMIGAIQYNTVQQLQVTMRAQSTTRAESEVQAVSTGKMVWLN